jgi:hypothetical protein
MITFSEIIKSFSKMLMFIIDYYHFRESLLLFRETFIDLREDLLII